MIKKNFVSLAFSKQKIQIVKLNPSKKKALKFATIDLPQGLVSNHKVQDIDALSEILKNIWKKYKLKEKSVAIVVPEFSTFIKILELPSLESSELNEAVEWQAQEFLPQKTSDMTMDWRIAQEKGDDLQILMVAMKKEILDSYVLAAEKAGLLPMLVETPSLALVRASDPKQVGKLIIYTYFNETIIVIADKGKVLVSSVVGSSDVVEIVKTITQMVQHYKDVKIVNILAGGVNISQKFVDNLSQQLKRPVEILSIKIASMSASDIQTYLIPLSLQFKEPKEPADEQTINLLPKELMNRYIKKSTQLRVWSLMIIVTFMIWTSFIIVIGTYIYFYQRISVYKKQSSQNLSVISQTQKARDKIKNINLYSELVLKITKLTISPQSVINKINEARVGGINITSYKLELDRGELEIKGIAVSRSDLIDFKHNLEEAGGFNQVVIPISNFEVDSNLEFEILILMDKEGKKK